MLSATYSRRSNLAPYIRIKNTVFGQSYSYNGFVPLLIHFLLQKKKWSIRTPGEFVVATPRSLRFIIIWLCLTRTGNYQIHEFDWLKRILTAV